MTALPPLPAGFRLAEYLDPFEKRAGPFYVKGEPGHYICGYPVTETHNNGAGVVQGGFLLTFADFAAYHFCAEPENTQTTVTLTLSADFTGPARPGDFLTAYGEKVHATGRMVFVRGRIENTGGVVLNMSAIMRKIARKPGDKAIAPLAPASIPPGFVPYTHKAPFADIYGPLYHTLDGPLERVGLRIEPHHANGIGAIHGGALVALADATLHTGHSFRGSTVTLSLNAEFAQPGYVGEFIVARPVSVRSTKSYEFIMGDITAGDRTLLNYRAIIKKFDSKR